jgi:hypothetical protein
VGPQPPNPNPQTRGLIIYHQETILYTYNYCFIILIKMDLVSPVQFKKLDFDKFDGFDVNESNDEPISNESSTIENNIDNTSLVFYDKYSKNIIQFKHNFIKIFNKNATNLKKSLILQLDKSKINISCVDKHLRYMLVLIDFKMTLIINLKTEKVSDILHYDFSTILGMFFITSGSHFNVSEELKFCLIFVNKLVYFKISYTPNELINELKTIKLGFNCINFLYNSHYQILASQKQDIFSFEFYNLSSEKYITKTHSFNGLLKSRPYSVGGNTSTFNKFFSLFGGGNKGNTKGDQSLFMDIKKHSLFKRTQFFLETL